MQGSLSRIAVRFAAIGLLSATPACIGAAADEGSANDEHAKPVAAPATKTEAEPVSIDCNTGGLYDLSSECTGGGGGGGGPIGSGSNTDPNGKPTPTPLYIACIDTCAEAGLSKTALITCDDECAVKYK